MFPIKSRIHKIITKKDLYTKFAKEIPPSIKEMINKEVSKIVIANELSESTLNISKGEIKRIFVIELTPKNGDISDGVIAFLGRVLKHKLIFRVKGRDKFAIYYKKVYVKNTEDIAIRGLDLDEVWQNILSYFTDITGDENIDEQIRIKEEKEKILKKIEKLKRKKDKEVQPNKKLEIRNEITKLEKRLNE